MPSSQQNEIYAPSRSPALREADERLGWSRAEIECCSFLPFFFLFQCMPHFQMAMLLLVVFRSDAQAECHLRFASEARSRERSRTAESAKGQNIIMKAAKDLSSISRI